ncbi:TrbG/VirB9 family P-type conjugative transfer protein [Rhizorhabdus sp. FW153]|uniref:TrbG/VirB9 family P-type conjugative transfer protein n=1 Tax=Rhizorhabdus sp. FW153 TaxID=3400216 RepID=UPI003CEC0915
MKKALILCLLAHSFARAEIAPVPGPRDPQIQAINYDPDEVVRLNTVPGYVLVVEFAPDERVETMAAGVTSGWRITSNNRGNLLFVKQDMGANETNLTVITDERRYTFLLAPGYGRDTIAPYSVKFHYPGTDSAPDLVMEEYRRSYRFSGARKLRPIEMFDNGQSTNIRWLPNIELPAVYALDSGNQEMLVNGAMRGQYYVIDTIAAKFRFRSGDQNAVAARRPPAKRR